MNRHQRRAQNKPRTVSYTPRSIFDQGVNTGHLSMIRTRGEAKGHQRKDLVLVMSTVSDDPGRAAARALGEDPAAIEAAAGPDNVAMLCVSKTRADTIKTTIELFAEYQDLAPLLASLREAPASGGTHVLVLAGEKIELFTLPDDGLRPAAVGSVGQA